MGYPVSSPPAGSGLHRDRRHRAAALGGPIAREFVDMPAPQATRAMVGVAIAAHPRATAQTGKIFDLALKLGGHRMMRDARIELASHAWEARILPLN